MKKNCQNWTHEKELSKLDARKVTLKIGRMKRNSQNRTHEKEL
jgi:hypothetical protein